MMQKLKLEDIEFMLQEAKGSLKELQEVDLIDEQTKELILLTKEQIEDLEEMKKEALE